MDSISASTYIPIGIAVSAIFIAVTIGVLYGKLTGRIDALEKADESLKTSVDKLLATVGPTNERLVAIEIEQREQRKLLEDINSFLKQNAHL